MKKTYFTPVTDVIKIETHQMIAMSTLGETDATEGNLARDVDDFLFFEEDEEF